MIHGDIKQHDTTIVFHSGTKLIGDEYVTNGGRVLGIVGLGKDLRTALDRAYGRIEHIDFEGMQYRTDIGAKAFQIKEKSVFEYSNSVSNPVTAF